MRALILFFFSLTLFGQNQQIKSTGTSVSEAKFSGYLVDEENNPISGATVLVNKKPYEVKTDEKGYFEIKVHQRDVRYYNYLNISQEGFIFTQLPISRDELPYHQTITLYKQDSKKKPNFQIFGSQRE